MTTTDRFDVIVLGAGCAGLSAAVRLAFTQKLSALYGARLRGWLVTKAPPE